MIVYADDAAGYTRASETICYTIGTREICSQNEPFPVWTAVMKASASLTKLAKAWARKPGDFLSQLMRSFFVVVNALNTDDFNRSKMDSMNGELQGEA